MPQLSSDAAALELLPSAVLERIIRHLVRPTVMCAVSQALAAVARPLVYQSIKLTSPRSLFALARAVASNSSLASLVDGELTLDFSSFRPGQCQLDFDADYDVDALHGLLVSLSRVTSVVIVGAPYLAALILSREFAEDVLEGLVELEISDCFEALLAGGDRTRGESLVEDAVQVGGDAEAAGEERRSLREWLYYIELYPALLKLKLTIASFPPLSRGLHTPLDEVSPPPALVQADSEDDYDLIDTLHLLTVVAPLAHPQITDLLRCFNQLQFLSLTDTTPSSTTSLAPVLAALHPGLRNLVLQSPSTISLDTALAQLHSLDTLDLAGAFFTDALLVALVESKSSRLVELSLASSIGSEVVDQSMRITVQGLTDVMPRGKRGLSSLRRISLHSPLAPAPAPVTAVPALPPTVTSGTRIVTNLGSSATLDAREEEAFETLLALADKANLVLDGLWIEKISKQRQSVVGPALEQLNGLLGSFGI